MIEINDFIWHCLSPPPPTDDFLPMSSLIYSPYSVQISLIMHYFLCLPILTLVIRLSLADVETDMTYIKICNETSPISLETMNKVLIHKQLDESKSSNFKCFLHCLFTKYGWMDEDGGFLIHDMKNALEEVQLEIASLEFILFKCTAIESVDKCERALVFAQCFWKKAVQKPAPDDQYLYHMDEKK